MRLIMVVPLIAVTVLSGCTPPAEEPATLAARPPAGPAVRDGQTPAEESAALAARRPVVPAVPDRRAPDGQAGEHAAGRRPAEQRSERAKEIGKGVRYARCMTAHGVETPVPADGGPPISLGRPGNDEILEAALAACRRLFPSVTYRRLDAADADRQRVYAACMADRGVPGVPVPGADGEVAERTSWDGPDRTFRRAHADCREHLRTPENAGDPLPPDAPRRDE
jgi:hypothetical protein